MKMEFVSKYNCLLKELITLMGISKRQAKKIKLYGKMYINGCEAKNYFPVKINDKITIIFPENINEEILPNNKKVDILYEDEYLLIVNKPNNLAVQPSLKHYEDNLISRVLGYLKSNGKCGNCHVVTRLDYATSGLVLIAKYAHVHKLLNEVKIEKKYLAKVKGKFIASSGKINLPIARDNSSNIKRMVSTTGKEAITLYEVINYDGDFSILELTLITGRTHQIRVHLSHLGFPILGDGLYKGISSEYLHLHSYMLDFIHPINKEKINIKQLPNWL